jgi:transposase InsO family protein
LLKVSASGYYAWQQRQPQPQRLSDEVQFVTTDSRHALPVAPNHLGRNFRAERPNQKWVADITYIATAEGWLYLALVLDVFSRKIVGWAMETHLETRLVEQALRMALDRRQPASGDLLHHSDRGGQYASLTELFDCFRETAAHAILPAHRSPSIALLQLLLKIPHARLRSAHSGFANAACPCARRG